MILLGVILRAVYLYIYIHICIYRNIYGFRRPLNLGRILGIPLELRVWNAEFCGVGAWRSSHVAKVSRAISQGLGGFGYQGFLFAFYFFLFFPPACPGRLWVSRESRSLSFVRLALGGFGHQGNLIRFLLSGLPWEALGIKGFISAFFGPACPGRLWVSRVLVRFLSSGLPWEVLGIKGFSFVFFYLACPGRLWVLRGSSSLSFVRLALGGFGYQGVLIRFLWSGLPWEALGIKGISFAFFGPACPGRLWVSRESCSLPFVRLALGEFGYQGVLTCFL